MTRRESKWLAAFGSAKAAQLRNAINSAIDSYAGYFESNGFPIDPAWITRAKSMAAQAQRVAPVTVQLTDPIDYIFKFPDQAAAHRDPVVGSRAFSPVLIFSGNDTVDPLPGFWCLILSHADPALTTHPNCMIANDKTLLRAGQPSCISAKIDVSNIYVLTRGGGAYMGGLKMIED